MFYRPFVRKLLRHGLRYGTFWPGALAQDSIEMYRKRKRSLASNVATKRARTTLRARARMPRRRRRLTRRSRALSKFSRWNFAKKSIPNIRVNPGRFYRYTYTVPNKPGAALETHCLTDIPSGSRVHNNIMLKGFEIQFQFMPVAGCDRPTFLRFAIVVQTGPYVLPSAVELLGGTSHADNFINMSSDRAGWENRSYPLNKQYKVIYAKTLKMGPLLEAGATSVQSNLNAQAFIKTFVKYRKYIQYDDSTDNVAYSNNVFVMFWFDDDFRSPAVASTTTHRAEGYIKTLYRNVEL